MTPDEKMAARRRLQAPTCRILDAMRWLESGRISMPWHRSLVAYSANHLPRAGAFKGYVAKLKALELISYPDAGGLALEQPGREIGLHVDDDEGFTRARFWHRLDHHLGPVERGICERLRASAEPVSREALAKTPALVLDGHFRNAIAKLLAVGLIEVEGDLFSRTGVLYPLNVFERRAATGSDTPNP